MERQCLRRRGEQQERPTTPMENRGEGAAMPTSYSIQSLFSCKRLFLACALDGPVMAMRIPVPRRATDVPVCLGASQSLAMRHIDDLLDGWLPQERGRTRSLYSLSNGGQYVAPAAARCALREDGRHAGCRRMQAHLVGMAASLMVFDRLSFGADGARMAELYFCLHDYMQQVPHAMRMCALLARFPPRGFRLRRTWPASPMTVPPSVP